MNTERLLRQIVEQLERIADELSVLQGDVNAIRNGEYDRPRGAGTSLPSGASFRPIPDEEKGLGSRPW